jgi:hypothetical protein
LSGGIGISCDGSINFDGARVGLRARLDIRVSLRGVQLRIPFGAVAPRTARLTGMIFLYFSHSPNCVVGFFLAVGAMP